MYYFGLSLVFEQQQMMMPPPPAPANTNLLKNPSKVMLLRVSIL